MLTHSTRSITLDAQTSSTGLNAQSTGEFVGLRICFLIIVYLFFFCFVLSSTTFTVPPEDASDCNCVVLKTLCFNCFIKVEVSVYSTK